MKTFILSAFALFLLLSVNNSYAQDEDSWLKTDFPDSEVRLICGFETDRRIALAVDNNLYQQFWQNTDKYNWIKIEFQDEEIIINAISEDYVGTNKGLYLIYHSEGSFSKIEIVGNLNILEIFQPFQASYGTFISTSQGLYTFTKTELIKCVLPDDVVEISAMAFNRDQDEIIGLTTTGELYVSVDNCQSWTKAVENPEGHLFTAVKWVQRQNRYIVGSTKSLFYLTDHLEELVNYNGGRVNCIIVLDYMFVCETESKKTQPLFTPFPIEDIIAIGTESNGVYGITDNNVINQKNDSLGDLNITAFSYDIMGGYLYAGTKEHGIYRTQKIFAGSVTSLDLTPYALKISPNPAKSHASISFHNPEYAEIEIAIFDLFGRKVADVHSGNLAEGDYNFSVDLSGLASGNYFLRFGVGERVGSLNLIV
ncbi:MAG: T9SS type A sorting domain-containing protein, partial [Chlorobi bacterium]|nr:T9SS type A sorting domain-containing protein [Chlorobiota bacterium]